MGFGRRTKILISILVVIIVLGLILFSVFHIRIFNEKKEVFEKAKLACEGKSLEDSCEFVNNDEVIFGVCEKFGKQDLCCKVPVEKPISLENLNVFKN